MKRPKLKPKTVATSAPPAFSSVNYYKIKWKGMKSGRVITTSMPVAWVKEVSNNPMKIVQAVIGRVAYNNPISFSLWSTSVVFKGQPGDKGRWEGTAGGRAFCIQDLSFLKKRTPPKKKPVKTAKKKAAPLKRKRGLTTTPAMR